jgi:hypothetical protein
LGPTKKLCMLTIHQTNVACFFEASSTRFLKHLSDATGEQIVLVNDFFPIIRAFIDQEIRRELTVYSSHSQGHGRLTDMLIEINTVKIDTPLYDELIRLALRVLI